MSETKEIILTSEGMQKLNDELEYLKSEKRKEVSEKIKQALSFGDLSENSEYDEAKNEQAEVEARINHINGILKYSRVLQDSEIPTGEVGLGSKVKLWDEEFEEELEYIIVSTIEADPSNDKISQESSVGGALMRHKVGETVSVTTPGGVCTFKIIEISK